ncbi:hypothetical protein BGZ51_007160 [Haplosporangium sp. Z 767]|nr:hypothetical protein BGZ50_007198 [Haplosporangium sp. Z 11]KAF9179196.1 hypothetical protein BGZ51_007160 [Haplosporangium sp. Z 767]
MSNQKGPHVLIVGGGIAGLATAILLERAGISYHVFERAKEVKVLGAAMSLTPNILPVFEQLGLLEDLKKVSMSFPSIDILNEDLKTVMSIDTSQAKEITGYDSTVFSRAQLYNLLYSKVPASKISMGQKVMSLEQNTLGVMIRVNDGTTHHGDILVGADGAYSAVRQSLFKRMDASGTLPAVDKEDMHVGYICMVGTTEPLDQEKYPDLKKDYSKFVQVVGKDKMYSWTVLSVPDNRICWSVKLQLESEQQAKRMMFRNSEWGPEGNEDMIKDIRHFPCPFGGVLGDLIDATPRDLISKVYLEEKLFETWHHGRTVLIGDACHKMLPSGGQGAVNALQDAVVLVNCIYDMEENTPKGIAAALQQYQQLRYPRAKLQFETSKMMAKLMLGQTWIERLIRFLFTHVLPKSVYLKNYVKSTAYRPMAVFLPFVENRGSAPVEPQEPSKRYLAEQAQKTAANSAMAI